jgi:predicted DNA-binding transcriptional regulator YafY
MLTSSARLLRLLSHLQVPGGHTGDALAGRLGVSARTVRNDVATLRDLGYPVHAAPGPAGGYRLGAGTRLPPLLLDDEEAVAIALGLTVTADTAVRDVHEPSVRALGKVMAMLPSRLRARLEVLTRATSNVAGRVVPVDSAVLQEIAGAVQSGVRVRFTYRDAQDAESHREVEPYRLLLTSGRWYLLGWDPDRGDWRSFRIDRLRLKIPHGRPFTARPAPPGGLAAYAARSLAGAVWTGRHRVRLLAPAEQMRHRAPVAVDIVADGPDACIATVGSSDTAMLARYLSWWDADFEILDSAELLAEVRGLARRYTAAGQGLTGSR